jgi:hypothetical protein
MFKFIEFIVIANRLTTDYNDTSKRTRNFSKNGRKYFYLNFNKIKYSGILSIVTLTSIDVN